jgi:hypothetical protein
MTSGVVEMVPVPQGHISWLLEALYGLDTPSCAQAEHHIATRGF